MIEKPRPPQGLKRYLLTGLLLLAPIGVSIQIFVWFVSFLDGLLSPLIVGIFGRHVPGLGLIAAFIAVALTGAISSNMVGHHLVALVEDLLLHVPGLNWLYRTAKQLADIFSPEGSASFKRVVLIEYPRLGTYRVGFVTREIGIERAQGERRLLAVYVPTNNLYIGDVVLASPESVLDTELSLQEGIQAVLSGGASLPERIVAPPPAGPDATTSS